jgi:hypothetical protein
VIFLLRSAAVTGALICVPALAQTSTVPASDLSPFATERQNDGDGVKRNVYSVGVQGEKHSLKAGDGNELTGNSASVQLGTGYIADKWYTTVSLDIILGPYEPVRNRELNSDFVGTGLTWFSGISAQTQNLRSPEGGYGFALGLSYADIIGRTVSGRSQDSRSGKKSETIDNYIMRVNKFSMMPAVFFSWLKDARPKGNSPELLTTRLEGYLLTIGVAIPLLTTYSAKYTVRDESQTELAPSREQKDSGQLRGYSVLLALTSFLGT